MPETKQISTFTNLNVVGTEISIYTYYGVVSPSLLEVFLADVVGISNGVPYIEGEGIAILAVPLTELDLIVDNDGDLNIIGDEALDYSIDSDGNLIYNY